jgi:hypothetical protein
VIERCIENWHKHLRGELPGGLDALLDEDVVFYSPIVFSPQRGKKITKQYLTAAANTFTGGDGTQPVTEALKAGPRQFKYAKEILSGNQAMLEFESEVEGKYINGVDIITCNDEGRIIEFKVMIRPLQAVNLMHKQMAAMLEKLDSR